VTSSSCGPPAEILATRDEDGCLDGLPFMPEMLQYLGGRLTVAARVERARDTINGSGVRTMPNTVLLDDLRCDGSAHDGCQAGCRLYWREAWLRRVPAGAAPAPQSTDDTLQLEERIRRNTRRTREGDGRQVETYRCQATDFQHASKDLSWYDPGSFIREATCGNVGLLRWLVVTTQAALIVIRQRLGIRVPYPVQPRPQANVASGRLDLKPGELVRVRSKAEIEQTLDPTGKTRGLWFDREKRRPGRRSPAQVTDTSTGEGREPNAQIAHGEAVQVPSTATRDLLGLGSKKPGELPLEAQPWVLLDDPVAHFIGYLVAA
jgi:hypothetical protein